MMDLYIPDIEMFLCEYRDGKYHSVLTHIERDLTFGFTTMIPKPTAANRWPVSFGRVQKKKIEATHLMLTHVGQDAGVCIALGVPIRAKRDDWVSFPAGAIVFTMDNAPLEAVTR
jgi:hypothetical protein